MTKSGRRARDQIWLPFEWQLQLSPQDLVCSQLAWRISWCEEYLQCDRRHFAGQINFDTVVLKPENLIEDWLQGMRERSVSDIVQKCSHVNQAALGEGEAPFLAVV